jgi:tRNA (cytidine/uridine-2'-O-)-methyltransferase
VPYIDFAFEKNDTLLLGRESAGVPQEVHAMCDARLRIPLAGSVRSLNVAVAGAMVLGEALRQTQQFPA